MPIYREHSYLWISSDKVDDQPRQKLLNMYGLIVMACLIYVTSGTDSSQCLPQYYTCLSTFGINATGQSLVPLEQELYTEHVMNLLCPHIGRFADCYDKVMKCIQANYTDPAVMTNEQLTHLMEITCMHKSVLIGGQRCLTRINYTQIQIGCSNKTQQMIEKLINADVSVQEIMCRSVEMSTSCVFTSPAVMSCGNDLITALKVIANESSKIMCDRGTTTVSPMSASQDPGGILG